MSAGQIDTALARRASDALAAIGSRRLEPTLWPHVEAEALRLEQAVAEGDDGRAGVAVLGLEQLLATPSPPSSTGAWPAPAWPSSPPAGRRSASRVRARAIVLGVGVAALLVVVGTFLLSESGSKGGVLSSSSSATQSSSSTASNATTTSPTVQGTQTTGPTSTTAAPATSTAPDTSGGDSGLDPGVVAFTALGALILVIVLAAGFVRSRAKQPAMPASAPAAQISMKRLVADEAPERTKEIANRLIYSLRPSL